MENLTNVDGKIVVEDAGEFLEDLQKMINSAVEQRLTKHLNPIKNVLNTLLVEKTYTISEVAAIMNKHHVTIRKWIEDGKLKATQYGRHWEITQTDFDEFREKKNQHSSYHD